MDAETVPIESASFFAERSDEDEPFLSKLRNKTVLSNSQEVIEIQGESPPSPNLNLPCSVVMLGLSALPT